MYFRVELKGGNSLRCDHCFEQATSVLVVAEPEYYGITRVLCKPCAGEDQMAMSIAQDRDLKLPLTPKDKAFCRVCNKRGGGRLTLSADGLFGHRDDHPDCFGLDYDIA